MNATIPPSESVTTEFKREIPKNSQMVKTIVAFSNTMGGKIFIGIGDDRSVSGISSEEAAFVLENLAKTIYDSITPPVLPAIAAIQIESKYIIVVSVSSGTQRPYFVSADGLEKGCYIRVGRSTLRANPEILTELQWRGRGISPDAIPVYHSTALMLDIDLFSKFLNKQRPSIGRSDFSKYLHEYNLVIEEHGRTYPSRAGLLLFGKFPQQFFPEAFVITSHFRGTVGREAIASRDCAGCLMSQLELASEFLSSNLSKSFSISSITREEQFEIPQIVLREILVNALVHRDYSIASSVKIAIYQDRVEVFSPGSFPGPFEPSDLEHGISYIRNPIIARVFREMGYIEKLGSGFITVFRLCAERNLPKPEIINGGAFVKVILFRPTSNTYAPTSNAPEEVIKSLIRKRGSISTREVQSALGVSRATTIRLLDKLMKQGKIIRVGKGRATRYEITVL